MWIMGLREEFHEAIDSVKDIHLKIEQVICRLPEGFQKDDRIPDDQILTSINQDSQKVPFFETVIRYFGGSLSAHALSGNQDILTFAETLGQALLPAFNTTSGLPSFDVDVKT